MISCIRSLFAKKTKPVTDEMVAEAFGGPIVLNLWGSARYDAQWAALHRDPVKYLGDELDRYVQNPRRYVREVFGLAYAVRVYGYKSFLRRPWAA